jgi:hypothetical protein
MARTNLKVLPELIYYSTESHDVVNDLQWNYLPGRSNRNELLRWQLGSIYQLRV